MALEIYYSRERHAGRWLAGFVLIALVGLSAWCGYKWYTTGDLPIPLPIASADTAVDESAVNPAQIASYTVSAQQPRYIYIPSLNLDKSRVRPIQIDANNLLQNPTNINDAGWYTKSATPGSGGQLVMTGHSSGINHDGVFKQLKTLKAGASIMIQRGDGQIFGYKVVDNKSLTIQQLNATALGATGSEGLSIITDGGKWVPKLASFDRRIVLRAVIGQ